MMSVIVCGWTSEIQTYQACTNPTGAESASPCRLQALGLRGNRLTGAGVDLARIIPLCTMIALPQCTLEAGDISVIADSLKACISAYPCRLQKLDLGRNSLTGAGADIARIIECIPLCTKIDLTGCKLEAGDISVIAYSIQIHTSPSGDESASPCRLQELHLGGNSLPGAGADIARIIPLSAWITLDGCDLNDEDLLAIVNAIIQTHSDRHTSVHDHSTADRRQTSRIKPTSHGPASHIEKLLLFRNKFRDVETVRLLLDNLPPSLRMLDLRGNQFNEEKQEIRRTYRDKHPNLDLTI